MADLGKLAAALSGSEPDLFETVKRSDFNSDDEFFDAAAAEKVKRSDPAFSQARREVIRQFQAQQEAQERQRQRQEYADIRASVRLDSMELAAIEKEAQTLAARDLHGGRIGAGDLLATVEKYKTTLTEKKKDSVAAGRQFNAMLRGVR